MYRGKKFVFHDNASKDSLYIALLLLINYTANKIFTEFDYVWIEINNINGKSYLDTKYHLLF
jgi:hypothetical protein